jgi:hypothetical protein
MVKLVTLFVVCVVLAMVGSFLVGNFLGAPRFDAQTLSGEEIVALARRRVTEPVLPPRPGGRTVVSIEKREIRIQVPTIETDCSSGLLGVSLCVPRVVVQTKVVPQDVQVTKLEDASPREIAEWEASVLDAKTKYEEAIQQEVTKISADQADKQRAQVTSGLRSFATNTLIALAAALVGLAGAIATLRWAFARTT